MWDYLTNTELCEKVGVDLIEQTTDDICMICRDIYNVKLSCNHYMCIRCLVTHYFQYESPHICPYCRQAIYFKESDVDLVRRDGLELEHITEQTPEICMEAVKQNPTALQFVEHQTHDICMEAVRRNAGAIIYVADQTTDICIEAVKHYSSALLFINNQNPQMCLEAIRAYPESIRYVKNKTDWTLDFYREAVKYSPNCLKDAPKHIKEMSCFNAIFGRC